MESVFYGFENENMNRKDLIQRVMKVAEHYKNGDLYATGAMTDIGILVDEYTETVVKNCSIPDVGLSLPDEDEINSMRLEMDCPTPNEEEYTTAGFKSGVRWLKSIIERQLQGQ